MSHKITLLLLIPYLLASCHPSKSTINPKSTTQENVEQKTEAYHTIVIEGTVISEKRNYYVHGEIWTSRIIEVNKIFDGVLEDKIIEVVVLGGEIRNASMDMSHGQIFLPKKNSTSIYKIKKFPRSKGKFFSLTNYPLYHAVSAVKLMSPGGNKRPKLGTVALEVYRKMETKYGKQSTLVIPPATVNTTAIDYSLNHQLTLPNRENGLVFQLKKNAKGGIPGHLSYDVFMTSANSFTYLDRASAIVQYNNTAFGDSIVSKGNLTYSVPRNRNEKGNERLDALDNNFDVTVKDYDSNKILISWINTSKDSGYLQLSPEELGNKVLQLQFHPIDIIPYSRFSITGIDSLCYQYDYSSDSLTTYEYVAGNAFTLSLDNQRIPTIQSILPQRPTSSGDTITVTGMYFDNSIKLYIHCLSERDDIYQQRKMKQVPREFIVFLSDTQFQFVVPYAIYDDRGSAWTPTTGVIRIVKGIGDYSTSIISEQELIFK